MTEETETVTGTPIGMQETTGFADREDIMEAFNYAKQVVERSTSAEMAIYGTTAIQVIWNTLANKYHIIPKENV
tara:strand:- start:15529 stop:15750 length:222 start_codon:yes stop_codon:yes gene_type:complete